MPVMFMPGLLIQATAVTKRVKEKFVVLKRIRMLGALARPPLPFRSASFIHSRYLRLLCLLYLIMEDFLFVCFFCMLRLQGCLHVSGRGEQILTQRK